MVRAAGSIGTLGGLGSNQPQHKDADDELDQEDDGEASGLLSSRQLFT